MKLWDKVKSWWAEEEPPKNGPPLLEQPLPVVEPPPPPAVSHIYVKERGTGVFIPFAVFPEAFQPDAHGGMLVGCSALRVQMTVKDAFDWLQGVNCLRGFHDVQVMAMRTASPFEVTPDFLKEHARDR